MNDLSGATFAFSQQLLLGFTAAGPALLRRSADCWSLLIGDSVLWQRHGVPQVFTPVSHGNGFTLGYVAQGQLRLDVFSDEGALMRQGRWILPRPCDVEQILSDGDGFHVTGWSDDEGEVEFWVSFADTRDQPDGPISPRHELGFAPKPEISDGSVPPLHGLDSPRTHNKPDDPISPQHKLTSAHTYSRADVKAVASLAGVAPDRFVEGEALSETLLLVTHLAQGQLVADVIDVAATPSVIRRIPEITGQVDLVQTRQGHVVARVASLHQGASFVEVDAGGGIVGVLQGVAPPVEVRISHTVLDSGAELTIVGCATTPALEHVVVSLHGGPESYEVNDLRYGGLYLRLIAAGCIVGILNYRGSTRLPQATRAAAWGHWRTVSAQDIAEAIGILADQATANAEVSLLGFSFGATLALANRGQPVDRVVAVAAMTDLAAHVAQIECEDERAWFAQRFGPDCFAGFSPSALCTPVSHEPDVTLIHGTHDPICRLDDVRACTALRPDWRLVLLNQGHTPADGQQLRDRSAAVFEALRMRRRGRNRTTT